MSLFSLLFNINKIKSIPAPHEELGPDNSKWPGAKFGEFSRPGAKFSEFSMSYTCHELCGFIFYSMSNVWTRVWKLKVPERIRCFVWILQHDRLLS
jgi:hypothetical protein